MFTSIGSFLIGYCLMPVTAFFFVLFLVMFIDEEFDFGINDRIVDAIERIHKTKGISK